jgi:hypothetical protein
VVERLRWRVVRVGRRCILMEWVVGFVGCCLLKVGG